MEANRSIATRFAAQSDGLRGFSVPRPADLRRDLQDWITPVRAQGGPRRPVTEDERRREVVPGAATAHLDDIHAKLAELACHDLELTRSPDSSLIRPELVAEHVAQLSQLAAAAEGAQSPCRHPVVLGGAQQVRVGVAQVGGEGVTPPKVGQGRPPLQRVVDDGALRPRSGRRP
jgi:hypothetical protein